MCTFTSDWNCHYQMRKSCFPHCFCMPVLVLTGVTLLTSLTLRKWVFFGYVIVLNLTKSLVTAKEDGRVQHVVQLACLSWRLQWLQFTVQNLRCLSELEQWSRKLLSRAEIASVKTNHDPFSLSIGAIRHEEECMLLLISFKKKKRQRLSEVF